MKDTATILKQGLGEKAGRYRVIARCRLSCVPIVSGAVVPSIVGGSAGAAIAACWAAARAKARRRAASSAVSGPLLTFS